MNGEKKLTLEDLEVCIKVVAEFIKQYRRAEKLMRMMGHRGAGLTLGRGNLMDILLEQSLARTSSGMSEEEIELTEEDVKRLEDIISKYKSSSEQ